MKILVTGANGFVGKNLVSTLKNIKDGKDQTRNINIQDIYTYDIENTIDDLKEYAKDCDFVFHLAGVNRPKNIEEFYEGNTNFTGAKLNGVKLSEADLEDAILLDIEIDAMGIEELQELIEYIAKYYLTLNRKSIYFVFGIFSLN